MDAAPLDIISLTNGTKNLVDILYHLLNHQIRPQEDREETIRKLAETLNITNFSFPNTSAAPEVDDICHYEKQDYLVTKFYLVAVCGTSLSTISVFENALLLYLFITRPQFRTSHLFYMMFLAFFDIFMSISYMCLMSVGVLMDFTDSLSLYFLWHGYLRPMFAVSHVAMAASSFLIVAATFERFLSTSSRFQKITCVRNYRPMIAVFAIAMGVIVRGTVFWELEVKKNPNCDGWGSMIPARSDLAANPTYDTYWRFWFRNLTTVFLPFFVLCFCNISIVIALRKQNRETMRTMMLQVAVGNWGTCGSAIMGYKTEKPIDKVIDENASTNNREIGGRKHGLLARTSTGRSRSTKRRQAAEQTKASVRAATRMLLLVVSCYLIANALNVVITAWEHINQMNLYMHHFAFYTMGSDVVSLLTVLASALRLPIYSLCNRQIRTELGSIIVHLVRHARIFTRCCRTHRHRPTPYTAEVIEASASPSNSNYTLMVPLVHDKKDSREFDELLPQSTTVYKPNWDDCERPNGSLRNGMVQVNRVDNDPLASELDFLWHWESAV